MIGLFIICTGKYHQFIENLIKSADKYFLPDEKVVYIVLTDKPDRVHSMASPYDNRDTLTVLIQHEPWPMPTLKRFEYFNQAFKNYGHENAPGHFKLKGMTHAFYIDADAEFVSKIDANDLAINENMFCLTEHCGNVIGMAGSFEKKKTSLFYIDSVQSDTLYFAGGFYGGEINVFKHMTNNLSSRIDGAIENNMIPVWNDETALNWYWHAILGSYENSIAHHYHTGIKILSPEYHYPEPTPNHVPHIHEAWKKAGITYTPKIMLIDKSKNEPWTR